MKLNKEFEDKLRKLLSLIEDPLVMLKDEMDFWTVENKEEEKFDEKLSYQINTSLQLRIELTELLGRKESAYPTPLLQLDLEDAINQAKKNENY